MNYFATLLLLSFCFSLAQSQDPLYEDIPVPFNIQLRLSPGQSKYYRCDLNSLPKNLSLLLSALSSEGKSARVYASLSQEQVSIPERAEYSSTTDAGDLILISNPNPTVPNPDPTVPSPDPAAPTYVYIVFSCGVRDCENEFELSTTKELKAEADGKKHFQGSYLLAGAKSTVIRLHSPAVDDGERIVINVEGIPTKSDLLATFELFINIGDTIPHTSKASNIARVSWFEGKTIVIHKNTPLFCTNCNYTLFAVFSDTISLSFEAHLFTTSTPLGGQAILDGVQQERYNSYNFKIRNPQEEIAIDIKPHQGQITAYIECGNKPPADFGAYHWVYQIVAPEEIILTPREHEKCTSDNYNVVVYGTEASVYSIREISKQASNLYLQKNSPILGDIFPGETISYEIFIPVFAVEQFMVTLTAASELDLNITSCRFSSDCPGLLPGKMEANYSSSMISQSSEKEFTYEVLKLSNGKRVVIDPFEAGCYPILIEDRTFMDEPIPVCAYKIILHSSQAAAVEYNLVADSKGHEWLFVGKTKFNSITTGNFAYYLLYIPQIDVSMVTIQLTKFSGDVDMYVSRTEKYPDAQSGDTNFSHEGMVVFANTSNLNGTFYIAVEGLQTSSYSISATVIGQNGEPEDYALALEEGKPQSGVLLPKHEHPAKFYKIVLDMKDDWEGVLKIMVNTLRGKVILAVNNNGQAPLPATAHMWKAKNQELEISSTDRLFQRKGTYYIGIFVDWADEDFSDLTDIPFTLVYYLKEKGSEEGQIVNKKHILISPLTPYHGRIKKGEIKYFEASVLPNDEFITVYKQSDSGGVDLYVSVDPENKYPSTKTYTHTTINTHKNYLELDLPDVHRACPDSLNPMCSFYITVVPSSQHEETYFSLFVKRDYRDPEANSITPLEDGKQLTLHTPSDGVPALFYFYPLSTKQSIVSVSSPGNEIIIYAKKKIIEIGKSSRHDIEPPTPEIFDFSSRESQAHSVGLAHITIPKDSNPTIIALAVYFKSKSNVSGTFTIFATSQLVQIYTGQPTYGVVPQDTYIYYRFNINKESCTLLISLTTLDEGNPDLVVSYGREERPTVASHQFASISDQRTELIEISLLDMYPLTTMAGEWIIGVYGRSSSAFTLTVLFEDQKMVELKSGLPFEMYLKEKSSMYFKYYQEETNPLEISLSKFSGDIDAHIVNIEQNVAFAEHLPNSSYFYWKMDKDKNFLKIEKDDPKACSNCLYLVSIEAETASKFFITMTEDVKFIKIQNGLRYSDQLLARATRSYVFSSISIDEAILSVYMRGSELRVFISQNPTVNSTNFAKRLELVPNRPFSTFELKKSDFKPERIFDGIQEVSSEKNSFYFFFENPTYLDLNYSFSVATKNASMILKSGVKHMMELEPEATNTWVFYSSHDNEVIKIILEFSFESETGYNLETEITQKIMKGLPLQARFWPEKAMAGVGVAPDLSQSRVMSEKVENKGPLPRYHFRQFFASTSKKGKYAFEVKNPLSLATRVGIRVYRSEEGDFTLDQNSEHGSVLHEDHKETLEVYLAYPGVWYLWAYSCSGMVEITVENQIDGLELESEQIVLNSGQQYMYVSPNTKQGVQYIKVRKTQSDDPFSQYYLSSSHFHESHVYDYDPQSPFLTYDYQYNFNPAGTNMKVRVPPLSLNDIDPTDDILFHIRVCPINEENSGDIQNFCNLEGGCKFFRQKLSAHNPQLLEAGFEGLAPGPYSIKVVANIEHLQKLVKFIPYPVLKMEIKESGGVSDSISGTLFGIVGLIIIVGLCYFGYQKFQNYKGKRGGLEMQSIDQRKRKQYDVITEEPESKESDERDDESRDIEASQENNDV